VRVSIYLSVTLSPSECFCVWVASMSSKRRDLTDDVITNVFVRLRVCVCALAAHLPNSNGVSRDSEETGRGRACSTIKNISKKQEIARKLVEGAPAA